MPISKEVKQKVVAIALGTSSLAVPSIMAMQTISTFAASKTKSNSKSKKNQKASTKPKKKTKSSSKKSKKKKSSSSTKKPSSKKKTKVKRYDWNKRFAEDQKFYAQQEKKAQSKKSGTKGKGNSSNVQSSKTSSKKKVVNCPTITNGYLEYSYVDNTITAQQNQHSKYTFKAGTQGYQQGWKQINTLLANWRLPAGTGKAVQEAIDEAMTNDKGHIKLEVVNGKIDKIDISYFPKSLRKAPKAEQFNTFITIDSQGKFQHSKG